MRQKTEPPFVEFYELKMMPSEKELFCEKVRELLAERNMSLRELADKSGLARQTVYNFFSDMHRKDRFCAASIANYFRITRKDWIYRKAEAKIREIEEAKRRAAEQSGGNN